MLSVRAFQALHETRSGANGIVKRRVLAIDSRAPDILGQRFGAQTTDACTLDQHQVHRVAYSSKTVCGWPRLPAEREAVDDASPDLESSSRPPRP